LAEKTVLVTGATAGLGLESSVKLARLGARLVLVGRDPERLEAAVREVGARSGSAAISGLLCDFSSQASVRALAEGFLSQHARLHILVNNAATVSARRQLTAEGMERTFAVNHLGSFLLTRLLVDRLRESAPARIVNVTSVVHRDCPLDPGDLQLEKGYSLMRAYACSKLAMVLTSNELARRLSGSGVTVNCLHPGGVTTKIWGLAPWYWQPLLALAKLSMKSAEEAADTVVFLCASPQVEGLTGGYYAKNALVPHSALAADEALGRRVWELSEQLTGLVPSAAGFGVRSGATEARAAT
jgi:NAD(P)-dependent dehydrogenase (short-subunit alcohol dehydrogenase family)